MRGGDGHYNNRSQCLVGDDDDSSGIGYMDKLLVLDHELDASNRVVAQAFFCEFNKQLAEERKHHRGGGTAAEVSKDVGGMLSYGHQDRAIYRRGAQWQGPPGYET